MGENAEAALMRAWAQIKRLQTELSQVRTYADALNARCVADTPDAERYRWLRQEHASEKAAFYCCWPDGFGENIDEAIDTAMGAAPGPQAGIVRLSGS